MLKLNQNYSDYTDETDVNYPEGKAINASSSENYDGTPLLAEFMNDVNGAHIAMYEKAYGSRDGINGHADTQKASQFADSVAKYTDDKVKEFADSVAKYTDDKVKEHADERGLTDGVHGATSEATAGQIVSRDEFGRAKVAAPVADNDITNKKWVLETVYPVGSLYWSSNDKDPSLLFGGTWTQIKDTFILSAGDKYKAGATGGASTVQLTELNLPAHKHEFTPGGSVSAHSHAFSWSGSHTHNIYSLDETSGFYESVTSANGAHPKAGVGFMIRGNLSSSLTGFYTNTMNKCAITAGNYGDVQIIQDANINISQNTENAAPKFTGTADSTKATGSNTAFSVMNPYVVMYCWKRIA